MAMEINPPRSKDPEQPRDTIPSHLIVALTEEAEALIQPEKATYQHPIDMAKLNHYTQEAYGEPLAARSAYLDIVPCVSSLFITLEDGSCLDYRLDDYVVGGSPKATVEHFIEHDEGKLARLISEKEMDVSDLIVFVRALDSITQKADGTELT